MPLVSAAVARIAKIKEQQRLQQRYLHYVLNNTRKQTRATHIKQALIEASSPVQKQKMSSRILQLPAIPATCPTLRQTCPQSCCLCGGFRRRCRRGRRRRRWIGVVLVVVVAVVVVVDVGFCCWCGCGCWWLALVGGGCWQLLLWLVQSERKDWERYCLVVKCPIPTITFRKCAKGDGEICFFQAARFKPQAP